MKRFLLITFSIILIAVSWLALDDITTGDQPHFVFEWIVVFTSIAWFAGLIAFRIVGQKGERGM